jgi:hypothetical protein
MVRHTGGDCYHAPEIEAEVQPDSVGNGIWWGAPSRKRWRLYVFIA